MYMHTFILEKVRWLDLKQSAKSLWKSAPKKCADLEQNLNLKEVQLLETWQECTIDILKLKRSSPPLPSTWKRQKTKKRSAESWRSAQSASPLPQPPNALRQRCVWLSRCLVVDLQYHARSWDTCEHPNGTSNYCPKETETCSRTWRNSATCMSVSIPPAQVLYKFWIHVQTKYPANFQVYMVGFLSKQCHQEDAARARIFAFVIQVAPMPLLRLRWPLTLLHCSPVPLKIRQELIKH